jgi:hypothetical protein
VRLTNRGAAPLSLHLQYPLLGCAEANLEKTTLAPGESTNLKLVLKWRDAVTGTSQNDFVSLSCGGAGSAITKLGFQLNLTTKP